jgi:hypothetical protein
MAYLLYDILRPLFVFYANESWIKSGFLRLGDAMTPLHNT